MTTTTPAETVEELLDRVATKTLQPHIDRLHQMANEADALAEHARVQAQVHRTTADAQERLASGYRRAIDILTAGLPSQNAAPEPQPTTEEKP